MRVREARETFRDSRGSPDTQRDTRGTGRLRCGAGAGLWVIRFLVGAVVRGVWRLAWAWCPWVTACRHAWSPGMGRRLGE